MNTQHLGFRRMNEEAEKKEVNIEGVIPIEREVGIIQPFKKPVKTNDTCGIDRDKNPCGDASEY